MGTERAVQTAKGAAVSLWWMLPQFETVEAWPGRGWLVALAQGEIHFVHDLTARLPAGIEPDRRFYDPPPIPRRPERALTVTTEARPRRRHRPSLERRLEEPEDRANGSAPRRGDEQLPFREQSRAAQLRTSARANTLLVSLLDARQRREWECTRTFWVHGPFGSVRLGRMYRIAHRTRERPDIERSLCVITRSHRVVPEADEWTSMLLTLAHDPNRFFHVANVMSGSVYGTALAPLQDALRISIEVGDVQHSVFLATDVGSITRGQELLWAAEWTRRHALLDAATAPAYLEQHRWILERAAVSARRINAAEIVEWTRSIPSFRVHS